MNTWAYRMNFRMQQEHMEQKSCENNELSQVGSFWQSQHSLSPVKILIVPVSFSYLSFFAISRLVDNC